MSDEGTEFPPAPGGATDEDPLVIALSHNQQRWKAEEENARRLGALRGQLLTLIAGLLGLGVFKIGTPIPDLVPPAGAWLRTLLTAAAFFLVLALRALLRTRLASPWWLPEKSKEAVRRWRARARRSMRRAGSKLGVHTPPKPLRPPLELCSQRLAWPKRLAPDSVEWDGLGTEGARWVAYLRYETACDRLFAANQATSGAISRARAYLTLVGFCLAGAVLCYVWGGLP